MEKEDERKVDGRDQGCTRKLRERRQMGQEERQREYATVREWG